MAIKLNLAVVYFIICYEVVFLLQGEKEHIESLILLLSMYLKHFNTI